MNHDTGTKNCNNQGGCTNRERWSNQKRLETKTHTTISIDSKEGLVKVEGAEENAIPLLRAVEIINAINAGFSPERAFEMIEDEGLLLDIIDLSRVADNPRQARPAQREDNRQRWSGPRADREYDRCRHLSFRTHGSPDWLS